MIGKLAAGLRSHKSDFPDPFALAQDISQRQRVIGWALGDCVQHNCSPSAVLANLPCPAEEGFDINHKRVLRMIREELQASFSSIEVVVRRSGFGYLWRSSTD